MQVNVASMYAHENWQNNTAQNVANVTTTKYEPIETVIVENGGSLPETYGQKSGSAPESGSGTVLAAEMTSMILTEKGYGANGAAIKTEDAMMATLLDIRV